MSHTRLQWILDDASSIDSIAAMEGLYASLATGERRAPYYLEPSVPRTAFKVQVLVQLPPTSWGGAMYTSTRSFEINATARLCNLRRVAAVLLLRQVWQNIWVVCRMKLAHVIHRARRVTRAKSRTVRVFSRARLRRGPLQRLDCSPSSRQPGTKGKRCSPYPPSQPSYAGESACSTCLQVSHA